MKPTKIEWTEATWNPSIGCSKVTAGCKNCYAEVMARQRQASICFALTFRIPLGMLRSVETQHPHTTRIPLGMPPNKAK